MKKNITFKTEKTIRIDEFLRKELPLKLSEDGTSISEESFSNSKIRRLILAGAVFVNGRECRRPAFELRGRSTVVVEFDEEKFLYEKQPDDIKFEVSDKDVLFEDENLIFINKPAFFPVEQTITGNRANLHDAVVDYLWKRNPSLRNPPYVGIMHRLDRETSGVILFTKNRTVNKEISDMFQSHEFTKEYLALAEVNPKVGQKSFWTVEMFMGRVSSKSQKGKWGRLSEKEGGQYSKTDFEIVKKLNIEGKECFLIKCNLYTGRTHQIRVHLSECGLPLLGDTLYGGKEAERIYLHACHLVCKGKFDVKSEFEW